MTAGAPASPVGGGSTRIPILHTYPRPERVYTEEDKKAIAAVRAALGELDAEDASFVTDAAIHRYLRARKFNVDKAAHMLKGTLAWRKSFRPHEIDPASVAFESSTGKVYPNGHDRAGRPILILCPGRENSKDGAAQFRNFVYLMERTITMMPPGVEQLCLVLDFTNWSLMNQPSLSMSLDVLHTLADHYPERLGQAILFNPPWLFWPTWKMITPFLDPVTAAKVSFVHANNPKEMARLDELFDLRYLEKRIGGQFDFEWHFETYWQHLTALPDRLDSAPPIPEPPSPSAGTAVATEAAQ